MTDSLNQLDSAELANILGAVPLGARRVLVVGKIEPHMVSAIAGRGFAIQQIDEFKAGEQWPVQGDEQRADLVIARVPHNADPTAGATARLRWLADQGDAIALIGARRDAVDIWWADCIAQLGFQSDAAISSAGAIWVARRHARLRPLLAFVHVPKTGGQSFRQMYFLDDVSRVLDLDWATTPGITANVERWRRELSDHPNADLLDSHGLRGAYPPVLGDRLALYATMLRHPRAQIVSYIRYIKHHYATFPASFADRLPPGIPETPIIELARTMLAVPESQYMETFWFLPCAFFAFAREPEPAIDHLRAFLLVGLTERYTQSLELLRRNMALYGLQLPQVDAPRVNIAASDPAEHQQLGTMPELDAFLAGPGRAEIAVYEWAAERFEAEYRCGVGA